MSAAAQNVVRDDDDDEDSPRRGKSCVTATHTLCFTCGTTPETKEMWTGHWTKDEHAKFLAGLQRHGTDWKKLSQLVRYTQTLCWGT